MLSKSTYIYKCTYSVDAWIAIICIDVKILHLVLQKLERIR